MRGREEGSRPPGERGPFERLVAAVTRRPRATLLVVAALALAGLLLALQLEPSASESTLVQSSTPAAQATARVKRQFGDDAVVVLVKGDLERTVLTSDLGRLIRLEGCLSGNVPAVGLASLPTQCRTLARTKPVRVVYGPGTFINTAASEIQNGIVAQRAAAAAQGNAAAAAAISAAAAQGLPKSRQQQLAASARQLANQQFVQQELRLALRYGLTGIPSIDDPQFVNTLVFDTASGINRPKPRFAYLFPSNQAALILIRMRPELSDAARRQAIALFQQAVRDPAFRLTHGQRYTVTGVPVVVAGLAGAVQRSIFVLLAVALVVMAATLMLVFRTRRRTRLLPLALALAATAITYGVVELLGFSLTMASIAALPVLIGLAVDYAIQLQARFDEAREAGAEPSAAALGAARGGAATIAGAAVATAAGFLVLLLSPIPMVHGFALLVVLGIGVAFACALTAGLATLTLLSVAHPAPADLPPLLPGARDLVARSHALLLAAADRVSGRRPLTRAPAAAALVLAAVIAVALGATSPAPGSRLAMLIVVLVAFALLWFLREARAELSERVRRSSRRMLARAVSHPRQVLAIAIAVALVGWIADTQTAVVSDVRQLVSQNLAALKDVDKLEAATGVSGEVDVTVHGNDMTRPEVINWMTNFQQGVLARHGYTADSTCTQRRNPPALCPALSLTDLFRTPPTQQSQVSSLLSAVPPYFSQAVISSDRRTAELAFGIRLMPLDRQNAVIADIRRNLHPPAGVTAEVAGLPVLAAEANGALSSEGRRVLSLLAGLAAVFLVLLAIRRRLSYAAIPLIPIALATGWSALVLFLLRIPLNPMSAGLGALVIAISTEFSVLLSARYREERDAGAGPERALELTYASTGAAVLASGATAIVGFGVLIASDISMLQDFGAVTLVDLTVSLLGVMVVLPAALVWAEQRGPLRLRGRVLPRVLDRTSALRPRATETIRAARPLRLARRGPSWPLARARRGRSGA